MILRGGRARTHARPEAGRSQALYARGSA